MRAMVLAVALSLLPAASGTVEVVAVPVTVSDRVEVPLPQGHGGDAQGGAGSSPAWVAGEVVTAEGPFSMIGFELPDGIDELRVRTSTDGGTWTDWTTTERFDADDRPDVGTDEAADDRSHRFAEPVWVEDASYLQVELPADAEVRGALHAELIDSRGLAGGPTERRVVREPAAPAAAAASPPDVISRAEWGADESLARSTSAADEVHMGVVHHTATSNDYSDAKAVMRAMYRYHTQNLGWADLGYNIVVDQEGHVYEGRAGGLEAGIIGAHARGYNTGSFGVSVIGNFDQIRPPQEAVDAVVDVITWQSRVHDIDPRGWTDEINGSLHRTLLGHRDVGSTACPGEYFYPLLDDIREDAGERIDADPGSDEEEVEYDATTYDTRITSGPSGTVTDDEATFAFSSSTGNVWYYECQMGDEPWYPCSSPRTLTHLEDGEHTFRARAVDDDLTREAEPAERTWTVKATPPDSTIISGPSDTELRTAAFEFEASEPDADFSCRLDGGAWQNCTSPVEYEDLATGTHDFEVRARDGYGNVEDVPSTWEWEVRRAPGDFDDIAGSAHEDAIRAVARAGIATGYDDGTFRPGQQVTRDQMATFLARALELPEAAEGVGFGDTGGSPHEDAINRVASQGITQGYPDGTYRPREGVTRDQMASFLLRALELPEAQGEATFEDTAGSPHEEAIDAVAAEGIAQGYDDGTYRPREGVTRAQMATFLARALELDDDGR